MKRNESVTKIMTPNPVSVVQNEPVSAARQLMEQKDVHHLPVTDGDKLVGMLTANDIMRVSFGELGNQDARSLDAILDHTYILPDLMNSDLTTVSASQTVRDAAIILGDRNFHSLPVVDGEKLVGIVTSSDLINYLLEQY